MKRLIGTPSWKINKKKTKKNKRCQEDLFKRLNKEKTNEKGVSS